jgi:hypothetical protein
MSGLCEHLGRSTYLRRRGRKPVRLKLASEDLEDEDLQMLNAGLVPRSLSTT